MDGAAGVVAVVADVVGADAFGRRGGTDPRQVVDEAIVLVINNAQCKTPFLRRFSRRGCEKTVDCRPMAVDWGAFIVSLTFWGPLPLLGMAAPLSCAPPRPVHGRIVLIQPGLSYRLEKLLLTQATADFPGIIRSGTRPEPKRTTLRAFQGNSSCVHGGTHPDERWRDSSA